MNEEQLHKLNDHFKGYEMQKTPHAATIVITSADYKKVETGGRVGIITAGTIDLPVAEEAAMIANEMGCETFLEVDAGVAGIHRLVEPLTSMVKNNVDCLIVVAGRKVRCPQ